MCGSRSDLEVIGDEEEDEEVYTDDQYEDDPILHYEAPIEKDDDEEEVFGERRTEERRMVGEEKSPTRDILKHRMRERGDFGSLKKGTVEAPGSENHSDFGKPAFFEEEEDPQVGNSVVDQGERPIVDVVREFLTTNSTLSPEQRQGVARWIRRGKKSRERMTTSGGLISKKERKQPRRGGKGTQGFQAEQAPLPDIVGEEGSSTRRARSTISDIGFDGIEHDNFDVDSTTQSAGDSAFRKIFHMLEDGGRKAKEELEMVVKDKGGKKTNLDVLQYALATVSGLAFLLLILLLAILLKRKLASKFKLFDEKSGCHIFPISI